MKRSILLTAGFVILLGGLPATQLYGQVVFRQGGGAGQTEWHNPMGQSLGWLSMPQFQKDLEIVPEQKAELEKLRAEVSGKVQEIYKLLSEGDEAQRMQKYNEAAKSLGEETEKRVREILLPHQIQRLKQIDLQMKLSNAGYGSANALATDAFAKELGITEEQIAQLKEKEREVQKEMQEKATEFYKQLNEEAREKLFSVLTAAQRAKLKALLGDKFEWFAPASPGGVIVRPLTK